MEYYDMLWHILIKYIYGFMNSGVKFVYILITELIFDNHLDSN